MRKQIVSQTQGRLVNLAWLSFQPDGAVSFGLNDRTFIVPESKGNFSIFNAFNRVRAEFIVSKTGSKLDVIRNPHFTYHPSLLFHLTEGKGGSEIFRGIADPSVVLSQQAELPWIRATTRRIDLLKNIGARQDNIDTEDWIVNADDMNVSITISIDLINSYLSHPEIHSYICRVVAWKEIVVRTTIGVVPPQEATLAWLHEWLAFLICFASNAIIVVVCNFVLQ